MNPRLMDLLAECVSRPEYQPKDGKTFCNLFVDEVVNKLTGFIGFDSKTANDIVDLLRYDPLNWATLTNDDAISWAAQGKLIVAGWHNFTGPHGHVCVLWPADTPAPASANWNVLKVPWVCSVGAIIAAKIGANFVFHEEPSYYKWQGNLKIDGL